MKKLTLEEIKVAYPVVYDFLSKTDMKAIEEKRHDLADGIYVNVESYNTYSFEERRYESHQIYLDVQLIVTGKENIVVEQVSNLTIDEAYDANRDVAFYNNNVPGEKVLMTEGEMLLLEPADGHMPCISVDESAYVKKAVFKIPVK